MAATWLEAAPPEEIDAGPVRLRRWRTEDAAVLARLVTDNLEHLRPWVPWARAAPTEAEEREFLQRAEAAWERRVVFAFAAEVPGAGPVGGMLLQARREAPGTMEIGYWMAAACAGRGYATASSRALTEAAFALPGVERVEIRCDEANGASAAVPRKLGFRLLEIIAREPTAPAHTGRGMIWAVALPEWAGRP
jgi:RimJ/RimL family protein N-acetyltransferase